MHRYDELDLLDEAQKEAEQVAETMHFDTDVDRRKFVFLSLAAAAATTFGAGAKAMAQGGAAGGAAAPPAGAGGGRGGGGGGRGGAAAAPPVPLENMEAPSWTFQPYPGGTGALLEKTYREKGAAAFARQKFSYVAGTPGTFYVAPWGTAALPTSDDEIAFLPAHRIGAAIKAGKLTSTRITKIYLDRLKKYNPTLQFAVTILEDRALKEAAAADAEIKAGKYRGPLHGVPWGVKDLFAARGGPTTWGAGDFKDRVFDYDAEIIVRLHEAGAVLVAKLSSGQFAEGGNWEYGNQRMSTLNPWNWEAHQSSSGSSAGPASASAAGCVAFGIGTETNGSIVGPTTTCGLSGLRPTYGRVSRYGGMVLAWGNDRVGPITRTVEDAAMVFNIIHGADEKDNSTVTMPFHFNTNIDLSAVRVGVLARANQQADPNFTAFLAKFTELGMKKTIELGPMPAVSGANDGYDVEVAAAFDFYVQFKAKELGVDVATLVAQTAGGGRGGGGGGGRGGPPDTTAAGRAAAAAARAGGAGGGGGGGGRGGGRAAQIAPDGHTIIDGQVNRWTPGRSKTAMDFLQDQRRRLMYTTAWQAYLKDVDLYLGGTGETTPHAMTGNPVAMVQYAFGLRGGRGGGAGGGRGGAAGRGGDSTAAAAAPPPPPAVVLNPQLQVAVIAGTLYNDDIILSVAHKYQMHTDWLKERPKLG